MAQRFTRFSAKCKLCKGKWTTEQADPVKVFAAHMDTCAAYQARFSARIARFKSTPDGEHYQMYAVYGSHIPINGVYVADKKCDARCMGATGSSCECSCAGSNHGVLSAA